ncbi:MAG: glycogen synthase [Candidatus Omnitrophica bacterium]|nr:glycogen synthase [Candidatus Omnitrophota bacterium]
MGTSPAFTPPLLRGMVIHPESPLQFDFIADPGDEPAGQDVLSMEYQRLINYFLASLAIPQKDLWVNLSPVEKDRIVPEALIKTELGRDLLAQDYVLKQLTASMIYPEGGLGKEFWQKIYDEASRRFGVTEVPVDVFNKVWIVPEKASVYEKGNAVYIVNAHLSVMLEADYLAKGSLVAAPVVTSAEGVKTVDDLSKQLLREVIVPAIEKEVNEGKNFARLRQMVYAMVLAQWYQDVFKQSVLNKVYAGQSKVAGIDLSDPANKARIYERYMEAYRKGVFNYIKEETDRLTKEPVPHKYFSGGFEGRKVARESVKAVPAERTGRSRDFSMRVKLEPEREFEPASRWYDLDRPNEILQELLNIVQGGEFEPEQLKELFDRYSYQVYAQTDYPVEGAWPVLKAISLLPDDLGRKIIKAILDEYNGKETPLLIEKILLMAGKYARGTLSHWQKTEAPHLTGSIIYNVSAEVYPAEGGLGEVEQNKAKGEKELGANTAIIQPWYHQTGAGASIEYTNNNNIRFKEFNPDFKQYSIPVLGREVKVAVAKAVDANGVDVYLYRDIQLDGSSYYTKRPYHYGEKDNLVTKEESMAFLNIAAAKLIELLEADRKVELGDEWRPAVVHANDGQFAILQAVMMSMQKVSDLVKDIFWAFTTHTYGNRGSNDGMEGSIEGVVRRMWGIKDYFVNAARGVGDYIDHTSIGARVAKAFGGLFAAVSRKHANDVAWRDPQAGKPKAMTNGAMPEKLAEVYNNKFIELQGQGLIAAEEVPQRPTARANALTKKAVKEHVNTLKLQTYRGRTVELDLNRPVVGNIVRAVAEKEGIKRAFTEENMWHLVKAGYNVLLVGRYQGPHSDYLREYFSKMEDNVVKAKKDNPKGYPGNFYFLDHCSPEEKVAILDTLDIMVLDSDPQTGAAEYSEVYSPGTYVATGPHREGVIADQGIHLKMIYKDGAYQVETTGSGNTLMPLQNTPESWRTTVYDPMMRLWNSDPEHNAFNQGSALTPRLISIMESRITSAANMRAYEEGLALKEARAIEDSGLVNNMLAYFDEHRAEIKSVLESADQVKEAFKFTVFGQEGSYTVENKSLSAFLKMQHNLEDRYGYDALLHHYLNDGSPEAKYAGYLGELFSGMEVWGELQAWMLRLQGSQATPIEQALRLERLLDGIQNTLEQVRDNAQVIKVVNDVQGGIDARNIAVARSGEIMNGVMNDQALDGLLRDAAGLRGVITAITPIYSLSDVLEPAGH